MLFGKKTRRFERLLVVEDEPLVAFDTEHLLTGEGYAIVATVDSVADALEVIGGEEPEIDLVLVDVNLSDGSGIDVARAARERGIPVLFVTGHCPVEAHSLATGWICKPYPQRDLLAAIKAIETVIDGGAIPKRLPPSFNLFLAQA